MPAPQRTRIERLSPDAAEHVDGNGCSPIDLQTEMLVATACVVVEEVIRNHHSLLVQSGTVVGEEGKHHSSMVHVTETPQKQHSGMTAVSKHAGFMPPKKQHSEVSIASRYGGFIPRKVFATKELMELQSISSIKRKHQEKIDKITANALVTKKMCPAPKKLRRERWVTSRTYDAGVALTILANSIFIGVEVEMRANSKSDDEPTAMVVTGVIFAVFFLIELLFRIAVLRQSFFNSYLQMAFWNWFDFIIVIVTTVLALLKFVKFDSTQQSSVFELATVLRSMRVFRGARTFKSFHFMRPLRVLLAGILATSMSCVWAVVLLLSIIYIFSIGFTETANQHVRKHPDKYFNDDLMETFGNLYHSHATLLQVVSGGRDWKEVVFVLSAMDHPFFWVMLFYIYIFFTYFAVLNVVTAMFCQSAVETSLTHHDLFFESKRKNARDTCQRLRELFNQLDAINQSGESPDGMFTIEELVASMADEKIKAEFQFIGIDSDDAWNLFKLLDTEAKGVVDIEHFILGCSRLRGEASRMDVNLLMYDIEQLDKLIWYTFGYS